MLSNRDGLLAQVTPSSLEIVASRMKMCVPGLLDPRQACSRVLPKPASAASVLGFGTSLEPKGDFGADVQHYKSFGGVPDQ